jgi:hypothetical protein
MMQALIAELLELYISCALTHVRIPTAMNAWDRTLPCNRTFAGLSDSVQQSTAWRAARVRPRQGHPYEEPHQPLLTFGTCGCMDTAPPVRTPATTSGSWLTRHPTQKIDARAVAGPWNVGKY